jgi:hypothetical protein
MKTKVTYAGQPEGQADRVNALRNEWWTKATGPECHITHPKLEQGWVTVHLNPHTRFPISGITEVKTNPETLDDEYDQATHKRRLERIHELLDTREGRRQIVKALESGAVSLTLNMKEMPTFEDQRALCVRIRYTDANGETHLLGVE